MRLDELRQELEAIAADAPPSTRDARSVMRPAVRRLRLRGAVASVVAIAVLVGAVAVADHVQPRHRDLSITAPTSTSTPTPPLSAATIADGRWSAIASFPLASRMRDSVVWTGSQMIVWGGDNGHRVFGDGAAYDPNTNTWRVMPPAPISARTELAAVWTGHEVIVWGGDQSYVGDYADNGAAFDPATWTWRTIAAAPLTPRYSLQMVWTGSEAIVLGGLESNSEAPSARDGAAYNPATNHWHRIANLPAADGATTTFITAVWTGREILVWELERRTTGSLTTFREPLVEYDPANDTWRHGPATDDPHRNVVSPLWTGSEIVAAAEPPLCDLPDGAQSCGVPPTGTQGSELDPVTGTWRSIPHGPADDGDIANVWTGNDLVVVSAGVVDRVTGNTLVAPGTAAVWDPSTDTWTELPPASLPDNVNTAIWTGQEIIVWGSDRGVRYRAAPATDTDTTTRAN